MKKWPLLLHLLVYTMTLPAQTLVGDLNTAARGSNPHQLMSAPNGVVFQAVSRYLGHGVFFSDGTASGTQQILNTGKGGLPGVYLSTVVLSDYCYLLSLDDRTATLWRYHLYEHELEKIQQFKDVFLLYNQGQFTATNAGVCFWLRTSKGVELWNLPHESKNAQLIRSFSDIYQIVDMNTANGNLVFSALTNAGVNQLWQSNGFETVLLREFKGGNQPAQAFQSYKGRYLLFLASDAEHGQEIWITDGKTAKIWVDLVPGPGSAQVQQLLIMSSLVYFVAKDEKKGVELWSSDGTQAGTGPLGDYFPRKQTLEGIQQVQNYQLGVMMIIFNDSTQTNQLWYFNNLEGTSVRKIKELSSPGYTEGKFLRGAASTSHYYFISRDAQSGNELWAIDRPDAKPRLLRDIVPGTNSPTIQWLTTGGDQAFFVAETNASGPELWVSDGKNRTQPVTNLNDQNGSSKPGNFFIFRDYLLFSASQAATGNELWVSKGLPLSSRLVADIAPGKSHSLPSGFMPLDAETFLFTATTAEQGFELWRSQVTNERAKLVKEIAPGPTSGVSNAAFGKLKNRVLFQGYTPEHGAELWISDGTESGTKLLKDIWPGPASARPILYGVNGTFGDSIAIFKADDGKSGLEFWRTNGTPEGTYQLFDFNPGAPGSGYFYQLTRLGRYAYFTVIDKTNTPRVWRSNGRLNGMELVADTYADQFIAYKDKVLFNGATNYSGVELWCYDTLGKYSFLLQDINPGVNGSFPQQFTVFNNAVYFSASDGKTGEELWKTDGTRSGTVLFQDINPGSAGSNPRDLLATGSYLHFSAEEPKKGRELWFLPLQHKEAKLRYDLFPGAQSSNPAELTLYLNEVYFRADNGKIGSELWKVNLPPLASLQAESLAALSPTEIELPASSPRAQLKLYPNPTVDQLNVQYPADGVQAEVRDLLGRSILPARSFSQTIRLELQRVPAGSYIVHVLGADGQVLDRQLFQKSGVH